MDSPINRMIDRSSNRKVASSMKAKAKRTKALNDQVLSLVHEANATALPERHVTPRAALIVMARAMKELSSLPEESRTHGVLREVSKFISLNQKTLLASASIKHVDLLPKGHPLSPLNASLTEDELRKKYAEWIAADPAIADEARPLVAMAHSLPPESIEREHAFLRLRTLQASAVPAYFKIDDVTAITAAFSSGNSSAARRARVALQWRDRFGQWIEMGRGVNFRFRMPDGSVATGKGNYVGAGSNPIVERTSTGTSLTSESGLIEVSGVPGLAPGLYAINSNNAAAYQARIPGFEAPQAPSFDDQFDADVPSIADLQKARRDLPIGWKKQGPYFVSDDNYAVIPGPNGQPQSVTRLNADGRPAGTVGNARNWSEVNDLIDKDQPSFDKEIARIEAEGEEGQLPLARIPGATEEDIVDFDDIVNMQKQRAEENKKFEASRPAAKPLGDKDLNGNVVPNSWTRDANDDKAYTRQMPLRDGGTYPLSARVTEDGKYVAGHAAGWIPEPGTDGRGAQRKFESWKEIESAIPEFVDYLNGGFTKDNPIVEEDKNAIMYYIDEDGNKVSGPAPETEPTTPEQVKKAEKDIRGNMEKNLPPREFPQEPRDDRYDARVVTEDLVEIDKSTLDALNKRIRKDSTGEYNMEGVTFAPDNNGNIVMYPDAWEPGDKIIGRIEDDGGIDWESDEQYDKYAEKVAEALRGMGDSAASSQVNSKEIYERRMAGESLQKVADSLGLTREEVRRLESEYARTLESPAGDGPGDFTNRFKELKDLTSGDYSMNQLFDTMFKDAKYETRDERPLYTSSDYEVPEDAKIYYFDQENILAKNANGEWGIYFSDGESLEGDDIEFQNYLDSILINDGDSALAFYQGGFVDEDLQGEIEEARSKEPVGGGSAPAEPPSGLENSVSKEAFNGLKNKIAEENKGGYSKSGLYFFHDLIGPDDGALSKDITFMIDEDEEFSPLGTISTDGTITWNDPSKQEDWAPALESALKSFTEGKDKFTKNKNTGYMEYNLGDGYVVSYGKDEDGNWFAEMNRFSRDGGLDSENIFPAKSEADARAMAEGLIDRYNDSQEWEGGDGLGEPVTYDDAVSIARNNSLTPSQKMNELFKNAKGVPLRDYIKTNELFQDMPIDPSLDIDKAEVVEVDGDGQNLLVRYPDNTYYSVDAGGEITIDGVDYISSVSVDEIGKDAINDYFKHLLDTEDPSLSPFYRGYWIDEDFQRSFLKSYPDDGDGPGEPPAAPDTSDSQKVKDVDDILKSIDEHMSIVGLSEEGAMAVSGIEETVKLGKKALIAGKTETAIDYFSQAYEDLYNGYTEEGSFESTEAGAEAQARLDRLITSLGGSDGASPDFTNRFKEVKDLAESEGTTPQEFFDALFKDAEYRTPTSKELEDYGMPKDAKVFLVDEQNTFVQHADGTWHDYDLDNPGESAGDKGTYDFFMDNFVKDTGDLSMVFYRGAFIDRDLQIAVEKQRETLYDGSGPDEEPPSPGGGTPPKAPSPSTPGSPSLFGDFDAPAGAFQLRTTEYEPEGRIDEASTDFTDDPRRLATKFTLDDLVTAFTEALIGRPSDEALQDILDANVGDDDDLPDLDDLGDVANSPAPRAGEVSASGAGALEFNAGEEYVQAEALYNAVYEAGGDPNRVIANAYDAVNGNRNNARKLLEAQGGVPSQEESQLIEDMTDEIRQIKDATPEDDEISASQKRDKPEEKFKGELIENVPVDFNNPDYFDMDTDAYIPSAPEIDENGYTDNPEILALDYESTDLIEQMIEGITDGSGVALLDFGGEQGVGEVPVEALRDALQLQAYNTNKILFDLRDESNDMSEEEKPTLSREDIRWDAQNGLYTDVNGNVLDGDTVDAVGLDSSLIDAPAPDIKVLEPRVDADEVEQPTQQEASVEFAPFSDALANLDEEDPSISPKTVLMLDDAANALVDLFSYGIQPDVQFLAYNKFTGNIVVQTTDTDLQEGRVIAIHPNGGAISLDAEPSWYAADGPGRFFGWQLFPDEVVQAIRQENAKRFPQAVAPESPAAPEAPASPFVYPGPREAGYSVNNTTLASDGSIVGAGSIVTANRDGKRGMVVSIQNDPEYVRIKFDDGKVAVRSANQIKAVSNPDGSLATAPSGALAPSAASPATDVRERLEAPLRDAPNIARPGSAWGINDASIVPNRIAPFTQKDVPQSKFKAWRSRDAEIAKAANTRASFDSLFKAAQAALIAKEDRSLDYPARMEEFEALLKDAYGTRDDLTFGADRYKVSVNNVTLSYGNGDIRDGNVTYQMYVKFDVLGENGAEVGGGSRYIRSDVTNNADGTTSHKTYVKNDVLKIFGTNQKKGFATAYNRHMENWYIANGVEKVKVLAYSGGSEWKGGFVWALNGFNWESGSSALSIARAIERAANTPEEKELATRLRERVSMANGDLSQMPLPIEMALIGWYNGADKWLGKEVMTNLSWEGIKHLDPGAKEQMYSANYDQIKSAERRVRAGQNKANVSSVGLVQIMDNQFQDSNPELLSHMEQIRDALRNNRPLGFLSPSAKAALNSYVSNQLLNKDSKMPMDDLFRLRNALDAEYSADYGFADPFAGISESLVNFSLDDFFANSDALKEAGFEATPLGQYESGQNTTFKVIHKESGQVFFVKEESLSQEYNGERGVINEIEANTILNALGMHGLPAVRASRENEDVFIMSQAGATLPLANAAINADQMHYRGIVDTNGQASDYLNGTYLDVMANPEDILSMAIIDMLGDSEDRHDGNWMVAFDSTSGKMRIFPIDHGLIRIDTEDSNVRSFLLSNWPSAGEVYQRVIPRLIDKAGEARTKEMFLNQVEKLIKNLDNPLYQPKGEELAALISKWGSYEAFKDAMKERLTPILTPGTRENDGINKATKRAYWR